MPVLWRYLLVAHSSSEGLASYLVITAGVSSFFPLRCGLRLKQLKQAMEGLSRP